MHSMVFCFVLFGWTLAGIGSSGVPVEASQEAMEPFVRAKGHKGSIGICGNGRKRAGMDANKPKIKPDQRAKSI